MEEFNLKKWLVPPAIAFVVMIVLTLIVIWDILLALLLGAIVFVLIAYMTHPTIRLKQQMKNVRRQAELERVNGEKERQKQVFEEEKLKELGRLTAKKEFKEEQKREKYSVWTDLSNRIQGANKHNNDSFPGWNMKKKLR
ncbi:MAG: hypothetical protein V2A62_04305 [Candidatus Woesearchaeota archaeon]